MKYSAIILFAALCTLFACSKDGIQTNQSLQNLGVDSRDNNQVTICHINGQGEYHAITVNQNAVAAHLAHGDYLPDADGDGYSAIGACTGSMDDCDDNNADVNPGAAEVCDNGIDDNCNGATDEDCGGCPECPAYTPFDLETLNSMMPVAYFDSDESLCFGALGAVIYFPDGGAVAALEDFFSGGFKIVGVVTPDGCLCIYVVGLDITEEQWESDLATLRAAIAANPGAINICAPAPATGEPSSGLVRNGDFLNKAKEMMGEKLSKQ